MSGVRPPAVAGLFYPDDPAELRGLVTDVLGGPVPAGPPPKALVVPHAGLVYSGPIAGSAYRLVRGSEFERVVLIGPSHRVPLRGIAVPAADVWETPLGPVRVDTERRALALESPHVVVDDGPHAPEHSLEVQLPFVLETLGDVPVLPMVAGWCEPDDVADVLDTVWGGPETLLLVSTDLSHYHPYEVAVTRDRATADAVVERAPERIGDGDACGAVPLRGLLVVARRRGLTVRLLDLRNSGDTAGDRQRVVGYGAFAAA